MIIKIRTTVTRHPRAVTLRRRSHGKRRRRINNQMTIETSLSIRNKSIRAETHYPPSLKTLLLQTLRLTKTMQRNST
jgi:hypothetical protein